MILGILKIFGILLGAAVLLLLTVMLALVFVPVRYRLSARVQPEQGYALSLRASWLLHLVSAAVIADASQGSRIIIRLFGIRLPLSGRDGGRAKGRRKRTGKKEKRKGKAAPEALKSALKSEREEREYSPVQRKTMPENPETEKKERKSSPNQESLEPETEEQSGTGILRKIWFQCKRICDKIRQAADRVRQLWRKLAELKQRALALGRKGIELLHKPGELLEFLEEYEAGEVFGGLIGHLVFLISHYKPRRIQGYLRFGTGDPSTTGQLTGLGYILLPARADRYSIEPEFNEKAFETETVCSGHIRALHVLRVLWRAFRDRKLRRIINTLRKKGDS